MTPAEKDVGFVSRYTTFQRVNHWVTAICFTLLALSGLALFHPSLFFLTGLFGGGQATRAVHPWIGVVLLASFLLLFFRFWRLNLWRREDTRWMFKLGDVINARHENLPEIGKYNPAQKLVFWSQTLLILIMFASGIVIWDQYFSTYTAIPQKRAAVLIHALAAVMAILIIFLHVYAGIWVKGTVRGMTRGTVTGGWAYRHHRKWLRQLVGRRTQAPATAPPIVPSSHSGTPGAGS